MDKEHVFKTLKKQTKSVLLEALESAYDELSTRQRRWIFSEFVQKSSSPPDGKKLLKEIEKFQRDSLEGVYYAPFDINSKNYRHIPEETEEWFDRLGGLLKENKKLVEQEDHEYAVECFGILYRLIEEMEEGKEIVFADELGSWLIPCEGKEILAAYITSLAAIKSPEEFTTAVLPFAQRDSYHSFVDRVYTSANRVASKEQKAHLRAELKRQNIPTSSRYRKR